jgi:hypothetical protein
MTETLTTGDIYFLLFVLACLYLSMTVSPGEEKKIRRKTMALRRIDPNDSGIHPDEDWGRLTEGDGEEFVSQRPSMN